MNSAHFLVLGLWLCVAQTRPSYGAETPQSTPSVVNPATAQQTLYAPSGKAQIVVYSHTDSAFIGRLTLAPSAQVPEHQDATEEVVVVLKGRGVITVDGESTSIGPGDVVTMPPGATVSFVNGLEPMEVLQVFAGPAPAVKYQAWSKAPSSPAAN